MFVFRNHVIVSNFEFRSRAAQALAPRVVICPSTWLRVVSLSNHLLFVIWNFRLARRPLAGLSGLGCALRS